MKDSVLRAVNRPIEKELEYFSLLTGAELSVLDENAVQTAGTRGVHFNNDTVCASSALELAKKTGKPIYIPSRPDSVCRNCERAPYCFCLSEAVYPMFLDRKFLGAVILTAHTKEGRQKAEHDPEFTEGVLRHLSETIVSLARGYLDRFRAEGAEKLLYELTENAGLPAALLRDGCAAAVNDAAKAYFEAADLPGVTEGKRVTVYRSADGTEITLQTSGGRRTVPARYSLVPADMPFKNRLELLVVERQERVSSSIFQDEFSEVSMDYLDGVTASFEEFKARALRLYNTSRFVMLEGERGLGKETWARAIHHSSDFAGQEFIVIDCNEFFDFTRIQEVFQEQNGLFSRDHVTVCFKEISKLSPWIQRKIADSAAEMTAREIRIIATTTESPETLMKSNALVNRLYMLFYPAFLRIPPVRERTDDIRPYIEDYIMKYRDLGRDRVRFTPKAVSALENFPWPGNFKQMEQIIGFLISTDDDGAVTDEDVQALPDFAEVRSGFNLRERERQLIEQALAEFPGMNGKTAAAEALGISKATLYRKIREYGLQ